MHLQTKEGSSTPQGGDGKTSNGQPEGVANPEGKPEDGLKYHGLKEMSSAQRASDFSERLDAIFEELEVDNNRI